MRVLHSGVELGGTQTFISRVKNNWKSMEMKSVGVTLDEEGIINV